MVPNDIARTAVNVGAIITKHTKIAYFIQPVHALTCLNTVSALYGLGKVKAEQALCEWNHPPILG